MKTTTRLLLAACLALPLAACQQDEAATETVEAAPVSAPSTSDRTEWRNYLSAVVSQHMDGIDNTPFVYLVPSDESPLFEGEYERLREKAELDVARGIVRGNMLVYAGPNSNHVADMAISAFAPVQPASMNGVRVVFVGDAGDSSRVETAVVPAGVEYVFVEK